MTSALESDDGALIEVLTVTLDALDQFFASLTAAEWTSAHGSKWTFCDVPVHLASFNGVLAQILRGEPLDHDEISTQAQLDAFNDGELARCGTKDGALALTQYRESAAALKSAVAMLPDFDQPIMLPILRARGWYKARVGVEYIAFHNWLHFAEAHLRLRGRLPDLPKRVASRAVDFYMQLIPGALNIEAARGVTLTWRLTLRGSGGGEWTIRVQAGRAETSRGRSERPDISVMASVETFFASTYFRMRNPVTQFLLGRFRVNPTGLLKIGLLGRLFNAPRDQDWAVFERDQAVPPA